MRPCPGAHLRQRRHGGPHDPRCPRRHQPPFAYHGDFDWPGIALANRIIHRYGVQPWRMGAEEYEHLAARSHAEGIPQLPLEGRIRASLLR
ncbi:DUF2399 domain-containing protein [Streptomyces sp. NRRL WC-3725]|uniref:DUF2399 domain-containing protein n=1 Tax=Streptomyces sp. NRRL WC-3725 TaxID=1463933 RepID=UPI0022771FB5|nr:DUF2399 domain-containing protein [Streptomyces sp. NRRL WC-3725]